MDANLSLSEQLEQIVDVLETLDTNIERIANCLELMISKTETTLSQEAPQPSPQQHRILFLESLPTWLYNDLRRKIIPAQLAARMLGMPQSNLQKLSNVGMIKRKNGRYDLVELLGYLEDTFSDYGDHLPSTATTITRQ